MPKKKKYKIAYRTAILRSFYQDNDWRTVREVTDFFNAMIKHTLFTLRKLNVMELLEYKNIDSKYPQGPRKVVAFRIRNSAINNVALMIKHKVISEGGDILPIYEE